LTLTFFSTFTNVFFLFLSRFYVFQRFFNIFNAFCIYIYARNSATSKDGAALIHYEIYKFSKITNVTFKTRLITSYYTVRANYLSLLLLSCRAPNEPAGNSDWKAIPARLFMAGDAPYNREMGSRAETGIRYTVKCVYPRRCTCLYAVECRVCK